MAQHAYIDKDGQLTWLTKQEFLAKTTEAIGVMEEQMLELQTNIKNLQDQQMRAIAEED